MSYVGILISEVVWKQTKIFYSLYFTQFFITDTMLPANSAKLVPPPPPPPPLEPLKCEPRKSFLFWDQHCEREIQYQLECERKNRPCLTETVLRIFQPVVPIEQKGPTCGLVALAMGLSLFKQSVRPDDLLKIAQTSGWSTQGEMCSCEWMRDLARSVGVTAHVVKSGIQNHLGCFFNCLKQGGSILVPYDKDKNMAPYSSGEGKNAHWALVTGLICLATYSPAKLLTNDASCWMDEGTMPCSTDLVISNSTEWRDAKNNNSNEYFLPFVLAFHGKSERVNAWPFTVLAESNASLLNFGEQNSWTKQPLGGIADGLCSQAVILLPGPSFQNTS